MIYNKNLKKVRTSIDCHSCEYFDKTEKRCKGGLGKVCFIYNNKTKTCINPITKLPIKLEEE